VNASAWTRTEFQATTAMANVLTKANKVTVSVTTATIIVAASMTVVIAAVPTSTRTFARSARAWRSKGHYKQHQQTDHMSFFYVSWIVDHDIFAILTLESFFCLILKRVTGSTNPKMRNAVIIIVTFHESYIMIIANIINFD